MSIRSVAFRSNRNLHGAFLASVSVLALTFVATPTAHARQFGSSQTIAPPTIAADAATEVAQQAAKVAKQARDSMSRATQAIQAMQGAQAAARAAAQAAQKSAILPTAIPNGLGAGGLLPNVPAGWTGANQPTQSVDASGQTNVNVNQGAAQAILNWTTFNVGARTTLSFDQHGNASWVALNRVDASTGPSQILGSIKADGTVLVINQSGIIFGGASQINVGSLIASTANITDAQFQASGIYSTQVSNNYVPSFTGAGDGAAGGIGGKLIVEPGALMTTNAPTSVTQGGGYVLLMGTEVDNAGSITTPKGQVELAAGHDFILRAGLGSDSNQSSTTRGNEIAPGTWSGSAGTVGSWMSGGGTVSNTGIALAQQGDITLAGHSIIQDGALVSTTSVNQRGTIHLLNSASDSSGSVTLTGNSLALILPELDSSDTALNSQRDALIAASAAQNLPRAMANFDRFDNLSKLADREDQSRIEIVTGGTVEFRNGSLTQAQGGQVSVSAVQRVFAEAGATIDVSGVQGVLLPMSANEVQVNIQGNELRDSPQNRDSGNLANKDVWIDVRDLILVPAGTGGYATDRYYTPGGLLEVSGYLSNTSHTIGEWTAVGGTITLSAAEVIAQQGSTFNIAGGSVQYKGGYLQQTYVLGSDGGIYNINDAPSDITFKAVVTGFVVDHPHWGVTEIYQSPWGNKAARWEDGYTVGRDAGSLILSAPTSLFAGDIVADVIDGERQMHARPSDVSDGYKLSQDTVPLQGTLVVAGYTPMVTNNIPSLVDGALTKDIVVGQGSTSTEALGVGDAIPSNLAGTTYLNASDLSSYRLGKLVLEATQDVKIAAPLTLSSGGSLNILSPSADIAANVTVRGGSVTVTDVNSLGLAIGSASDSIVLRSGATIDTRGLWTNALLDPTDLSGLPFVDGGDVTLRSAGDVTTETGSLIDASSGGAILVNGKTNGGAGGDITLSASYSPNGGAGNHGTLTYDGKVASYGVTKGGALTLETGGVLTIGGTSAGIGDTLPAGTVAPYDVTLTQSMTIPAGQALPIASQVTFIDNLPPDTPLPQSSWNTYQYSSLSLPTVGAWTNVPAAITYTSPTGQTVTAQPGDTIPAQSIITRINFTNVPSRQIIFPSSVLPNGFPLLGVPLTLLEPAGFIAPTPVAIAAGAVLPKGTVLGQDVSITPITGSSLSVDLFQSGFSSFTINGQSGLIVADNTAINAVMPVFQFTGASLTTPTGSDPAAALGLWMPPTYLENPFTATLTQRGGVDITLESAASGSAIAGLVDVGRGASITVDPGHSVQLVSASQITVDGTITAHGGAISLLDSYVFGPNGIYNVAPFGPGARSFWIGASAVLDVSGQSHVARDANGNSYGVVQDGGSITVGRVPNSLLPAKSIANAADAFIIIAPGAVLDASGTSGTLSMFDAASRSLGGPAGRPVTVASDGGTISLNSYDGIYAEGTLRAGRGGAGASGGTLNLTLEAPFVSITSLPYFLTVGRVLMIGQHDAPDPLVAGIGPGQIDASLALGRGTISADQIVAGGFDTVSLSARSAFAFNGDVSLSAGRSITLGLGALAETVGGRNVSLTAPYIFLDGNFGPAVPTYAGILTTVPDSLTAVTGGTFSANGDLVDIRDAVTSYFADTRLISRTDMRFLAGITGVPNTTSTTALTAPYGNMELVAEQLYPTSGAIVTVSAGTLYNPTTFETTYVPGATLSIESVDGTTPAVPYSVFGSITLSAPTTYQGGIVRAPLGSIRLGGNTLTELLPDSLTSVSAAGLVMPYGGTTDGVSYTVDGAAPVTPNLLTGQYGVNAQSVQGISLNGTQVIGDAGSRLDVSGGGSLLGAGFVSGRGGSVDTLTTPLINSNPTNSYSATGNRVYAIVPGVVTAPVAGGYYSAWTSGVPQVGQQITIPAGVPGLPAGTYTLLPANYALLPGGYRVELGAQTRTPLAAPVSVSNGSYLTSGIQSVANSAIVDALPTQLLVTPGAAVRTTSQYNEQGYSDFERAQAATFGTTRPMLPEDGKFLTITLNPPMSGDVPAGPALQFSGTVDFAGADGGYSGSLVIPTTTGSENDLVITGPGSTTQRSATVTTVSADTVNAFNAPNLYLGGIPTVSSGSPSVYLATGTFYLNGNRGQPVTLEPDAVLSASQVVLTGGTVTLGEGAGIDTLGRGIHAPDSSTGNALATNYAMLVVSNGHMVLDSSTLVPTGNIAIGENAFLYSDGTIGFAAGTGVAFAGNPHLGARELALTMPSINIGDAATLAAAGMLPAGLNLDQTTLDLLLHGDPSSGAPAVETLALTATNSINFYGSTSLDTVDQQTGVSSLDQLVMNTPAIFGAGASGDRVSLTTDTLVWNGYAVVTGRTGEGANIYGSAVPGVIVANGPGMGVGTLDINARQIILGYPSDGHPPNNLTLDRLMLGFSTVNLKASDKIVADNIGTLNVFQFGPSPDATYSAANYAGTGGALNLVTPLFTGDPGAILKIRAGGAVNVTRLSGATPSPAKPSALGAEIDLSGDSVVLDTAVFLPSGRLSVTATNDLTLDADAQINLAGQSVGFFDVTKNTWGGDVLLESTHGNIIQVAGSVIDISAPGADAGSLALTATGVNAGLVSLGGTLVASGGSGFDGGSIDMRAQRIGGDPGNLTADFAALNTALTRAGFAQSRSFDLKQGSLVIGDEVKARAVSVSIDGGSLTVNGTVDASGAGAGSIRLAARDDLVINGTLDARAMTLKTDADGAAIGASNAPDVELTTTDGMLTLAPSAVIDLRSADGVVRGTLTLNAPRLGSTGASATGAGAPANATGGDIAISATAPLDIRGARDIVLNGFARYANAPGDPNDTNGQLVTQGWLDLVDQDSTAFENAALANPNLQGRITGLTAYGSVFHLRPGVEIDSATPGGNIKVSGDIDLSGYRYGPNAGSATGKGEPISLVLRAGGNMNINGSISDGFAPVVGAAGVYSGLIQDLSQDPHFPVTDLDLGTDVYYDSSGTTYYLAQDWTIPDDAFYRSFGGFYAGEYGSITYGPGMTVPAGTLFVGWNTAFEVGVPPPAIATGVVSLPVAGAPGTAPSASPLTAGSMSSSLRLVAGADIASADTRGLQAASALAGSGNVLLSNRHLTGTLEIASVVRTGDSNLDILAGGNFSQGSIYNISTTGGGDSDPANLFIAAQGNLTSYVLDGSSVVTNWLNGNAGTLPYIDGFTGFGALNGGNVTIRIGVDAGVVTNTTADFATSLVVAATNGDVSIDIGGRLNPNAGAISNGVFTDLRGDLTINAASIGVIPLIYGVNEINDPRGADPDKAALVGVQYQGGEQGGIGVVIGNGTTSLNTRGDLALSLIGAKATASYWRPTTAVNLFSAGGNLVPVAFANGPDNTYTLANPGDITSTVAVALPPIFTAVAASGSIYYGSNGNVPAEYRLLPSSAGQLELLAQDSIYGAAYGYSGTSLYQPARFEMEAAETDATLHDGDTNPIRVYAVNGDLVNVVLGEAYAYQVRGVSHTNYVAAKAADVEAGRDIVSFGRAPNTLDGYFASANIVPSLILNTNPNDVSVIRAGRDMFYTDVQIAGPGTLEVSAGRNLYQGNQGSITSIGPIGADAASNPNGGAGIALLAGVGAGGPDYAGFAKLYFDNANLADAAVPDSDPLNAGKVPATYQDQLYAWLKQRFGYAGSEADALAYFLALPTEQQGIFARQVFYEELDAGGKEYNDPGSKRYQSYLRGRDAIAALFPNQDAAGSPISYSGNITMFGASGVQTQFGGAINLLTPGGQTVIGVEGPNPPGTAGLITQGSGDIDIYSLGSVLLGQSRIMTTFGGDILVWSAQGDINAGRGAKTTTVFTPPRRLTSNYGYVTLSPVAPSSGAGIATLDPIPEVPRGDINLVAPLGTIDAGEAGIRVSGNVNLAALQVLNAANIQVQGNSTGLPTVQGPPVAALTSASNTAAATQQSVQPTGGNNTGAASVMIVEIIGYGGDDSDSRPQDQQMQDDRRKNLQQHSYDPSSAFHIVGHGRLTNDQMKSLTDQEQTRLGAIAE